MGSDKRMGRVLAGVPVFAVATIVTEIGQCALKEDYEFGFSLMISVLVGIVTTIVYEIDKHLLGKYVSKLVCDAVSPVIEASNEVPALNEYAKQIIKKKNLNKT